jgi:hypothetical protein
VVVAGDLGEIACLRDHQLRDAAEWRAAEQSPPAVHQLAQEIGGGAVVGLEDLLALGEHREDGALDHRLEELLLAVEVEVERALRHARARGDVL